MHAVLRTETTRWVAAAATAIMAACRRKATAIRAADHGHQVSHLRANLAWDASYLRANSHLSELSCRLHCSL